MFEMQQSAAQAQEAARAAQEAAQAAADAARSAAADAAGQAITAVPTTGVNLAPFNANQLRRMLEELRSQRADIAGRRSSIASTYEGATGVNREAIGGRLQMIDNNIILYEAEIARVGRELAIKGPGSSPPPDASRNIPPGYMSEDDAAGMAFGVFLTTALVAVFLTRRFMGRKYGRVAPPMNQNMIQSNERLDRIEQAVDTIAVEMERVSENQRFMTRLMTETQLGDTLKDVRKSTELAKSAASESG